MDVGWGVIVVGCGEVLMVGFISGVVEGVCGVWGVYSVFSSVFSSASYEEMGV